jgi:hypothetical protein
MFRTVVATRMTLLDAEEAAVALLARELDKYEGGDYNVVVEGVKSDLNVKCEGDHWSKVILDNANNGCPDQPWYHACATVNDPAAD